AEAHERVEAAYRDPARWWRMSAVNIAHSGRFASDRTVAEYAAEIWGLLPSGERFST
ncbi:glycogen/starch/alpha-glucan phosphorylase, partial [Geobacillus sp. FW23]